MNRRCPILSIEYVGTASDCRGKGMASQLLAYILVNTPYSEYVIEEVADTNVPAMKLYKKMGFTVYREKPLTPKQAAKAGINRFITLKRKKPQPGSY